MVFKLASITTIRTTSTSHSSFGAGFFRFFSGFRFFRFFLVPTELVELARKMGSRGRWYWWVGGLMRAHAHSSMCLPCHAMLAQGGDTTCALCNPQLPPISGGGCMSALVVSPQLEIVLGPAIAPGSGWLWIPLGITVFFLSHLAAFWCGRLSCRQSPVVSTPRSPVREGPAIEYGARRRRNARVGSPHGARVGRDGP